ncbi:MAG: choice-of-anchor Q domain-containing protein [Planctomycetota bacterium]|jgi:hypothetical protein
MPAHKLTALSAAAVAWVASTAAATTYYVNGGCGSDAWAGTSPDCAAPDGPKRHIQAAIDQAANGDQVVVADGVYTGAGNRDLDFDGQLITVRSANGPNACVIDCQGEGRAFSFHADGTLVAVIQGFTITNGSAHHGGAILLNGADAMINDCVFANNAASIGGAIHQVDSDAGRHLFLAGCSFTGNTAHVGAGAVFSTSSAGDSQSSSFLAIDCVFTDNAGGLGPGAAGTSHVETTFISCFFARNVSDFVAGGLAEGSGQTTLINCVFSRNESDMGGGAILGGYETQVIGCTIVGNWGGGIDCDQEGESITFANCILWGNYPWQINDPEATVTFSDVEGGWPGTGNIDINPLFVDPEADNLRLFYGSPCVNAGDNGALPPGITTDIDGNPRILDGIVDLGAYEGEFDEETWMAGDGDLDEGEMVVLVPTGGPLDPVQSAAVIVENTSGPDDALFLVTEHGGDMHPDAGGYSELSCVLATDTTLADGQYLATQFIPFDAQDLGGLDPLHVDLTRYDPVAGTWALAASGNSAASPGFDGPLGDRIVSMDGGDWGVTTDPGDYGVYWDPASQQGFAWANVDVAQEFGLGAALCPADCRQSPDGRVSVLDVLVLIGGWGVASVGSPCDLDYDGVIGMADFEAMLASWGPCPQSMRASGAGAGAGASDRGPGPVVASADFGRGAIRGRRRLAALCANWGPCGPHCRFDRDGDGVVGVRDLLAVLAGAAR